MSGDGRYIALRSSASNMVDDDTNGVDDIFVFDRGTMRSTRISVDAAGTQGNGTSSAPAISPDARYVAFQSGASNLTSGDRTLPNR